MWSPDSPKKWQILSMMPFLLETGRGQQASQRDERPKWPCVHGRQTKRNFLRTPFYRYNRSVIRKIIMAKKKAKSASGGGLDAVTDYRHPEATRKNNPPAKIAAEGHVPLIPKPEYLYSP